MLRVAQAVLSVAQQFCERASKSILQTSCVCRSGCNWFQLCACLVVRGPQFLVFRLRGNYLGDRTHVDGGSCGG